MHQPPLMENQAFDPWFCHEIVPRKEESFTDFNTDYCEYPPLGDPCGFPTLEEVFDARPLSVDIFPNDYMFQQEWFNGFEGSSSYNCEQMFFDFDLGIEDYGDVKNMNAKSKPVRRLREDKEITLSELSPYFYMPITQAAKELNVGLTLLKKKCRELGIPRWPHRKMKSLQTLINNVQELQREEGQIGDAKLQSAIQLLEHQKMLMEMMPEMDLEEKTKKLRQACFKEKYKKRRLMGSIELRSTNS